MKHLDYPSFLCNTHFTCGYAVVACLSRTTSHLIDYDKSLGLTPRHQISLLCRAGLYATPVHFLSTDSLTPGLYILNYLLPSGTAHCVALTLDELPHGIALHMMDPRTGAWNDIIEDDLQSMSITSILLVHDCREPLYDLMPQPSPTEGPTALIEQDSNTKLASIKEAEVNQLANLNPIVFNQLGKELFYDLATTGITDHQIPDDRIKPFLLYDPRVDKYFVKNQASQQ